MSGEVKTKHEGQMSRNERAEDGRRKTEDGGRKTVASLKPGGGRPLTRPLPQWGEGTRCDEGL